MSQENLDLFRAGLAAWNEGDYEAIVRGFGSFDQALETVG